MSLAFASHGKINVSVSEKELPCGALIKDGTPYVSFKNFFESELTLNADITWDAKSKEAAAHSTFWPTIKAKANENYIICGENIISCPAKCIMHNFELYIPLSCAAHCLELDVYHNQITNTYELELNSRAGTANDGILSDASLNQSDKQKCDKDQKADTNSHDGQNINTNNTNTDAKNEATQNGDSDNEKKQVTSDTRENEKYPPKQTTNAVKEKKTPNTSSKNEESNKQQTSNKTSQKSNKNNKSDPDINNEDFYWLSRIIEAEAGSEPYNGKLAVGNLIMNRVKSPEFPSTVHDVIFDTKYGVQFTPTANKTIYNTPGEESCKAAEQILNGYSLNDDILYFVNHNISTSQWFYTRKFEFRIGNHWFYS